MNKAELEKKPLSELHSMAAEAGVPRYRMLTKSELAERLAGDNSGPTTPAGDKGEEREERPRPRRERPAKASGSESKREERGERPRRRRRERPAKASESKPKREPEPAAKPAPRADSEAPEPAAETPQPAAAAAERPRRRRRRRFGRRGKQGVTLQGLLLPPEAGRQAVLLAETREACTALLRGVAADLAADSKGPDPVALLIDPSPEELADWKRDAPKAEIVAAGQPRHASDALAQAATRAGGGEDVILLVDSLTRLGEAYGDAGAAKEFFDAGRTQAGSGSGSLTVVAALERPNAD